ncbi:MAG: HAD hydrolase-like protein [Thermodesulfobacteriota bacterium]|nr:HAD hydrolase-like protein [Thermodesulfobacteriota bacterium]
MRLLKYRVIVFDFDGVLVESADIKTKAYAELYKEYGPEVVEKVVQYDQRYGGISRFEKIRYCHREFLGRDPSHDEEVSLWERFSELVEKAVEQAPWVPGADRFLNRYYRVTHFYIASGTPEDELSRIISGRHLSHYFKGVYGAPKKKGEIIGSILSESEVRSDEMVMIGDSITDYEGAMRAGIDFIGREHREAVFPKEVMRIKDFNDSLAIQMALFYEG